MTVREFNNLQIPITDIENAMERIGSPVRELRRLDAGDDSEVLLCNGLFVIKIPKRPSVRVTQQREFAVYSFLKQYDLPALIPEVIFQCNEFNVMSFIPGENFGFQEYALLSEKEKEALASDMAIFLRRLHGISVPLSEKPFCEIFEDKRKRYLEDQEQLLEVLENRKLLNAPLQKNIQTIYEHIGQNQELFDYAACLVHNDFSSSNMVFRHNRLYGVIDFGDVIVGDPDNDFLCLLDCSMDDFGKNFGRKVLRHYGHRNPQLAERKAEINDAYWPIQQVLLGVQREDRSLFCKGYRELLTVDPDAFIL